MKKYTKKTILYCLSFILLFNLLSYTQTYQTIQINSCDQSTGWTTSNLNVSVETTKFIEGQGSILVQAAPTLTLGGWSEISFTPQITNFSVANVLSFWLNFNESAGRIENMQLVLYDGNLSSATWSFYYKVPLGEWNFYTFWLDRATSGNANLDLTNITRVSLRIQQSKIFNIAFSFYLDDIRLYSGYSYEKFSELEAKCEIYESLQEKAANSFLAREISPWVDITNLITPADKARGFVEVAVSIYGSDGARWKFIGDDDAGAEKDLRAFCDGIVYEINNTSFKSASKEIVHPLGGRYYGASPNSWVVLEYLVPTVIQDFYKVYIGNNFEPADQLVDVKRIYWMSTYYKATAYKIDPLPGIYANIKILNVPQEAKWEYDPVKQSFYYLTGKYKVVLGSEIEFDASDSVVYKTGSNIVSYNWDFGDNTTASGIKVKHIYNNVGEYKVTLVLQSSDGKTFPEYPYARKTIYIEVLPAPSDIKLYQNGPNPFDLSVSNPVTRIKFELSEETEVTLKIYSMTGRVIKTLVDKKTMPAGTWEVSWDGKSEDGKLVESGLYFYGLITPTKSVTKKMLILR